MLPEVLRLAAEQAPMPASSATSLTERERETLSLMVKGMPVKRIAAEMSISPSSVDTHMRNLYRKLHVSNRGEAINAALRYGLVRVGEL
jgi:DNA-binding CsgD family transcriptional regulator